MRTWLITGASRGFGREIAIAALEAGDNVVATARRPELLADLVTKYGERTFAFPLDVTDPASAAQAVQRTVDTFGRLDVVVNNAGYTSTGALETMPMEDFHAQIEANFFGTVYVTRAALPILRAQRSGHFLQFSSVGGRVGGTPGNGAYQSAKHAVEGFSKVLRNEVGPLGVKVTIVEPGAFRTDYGNETNFPPVIPDYEQTVGRMNEFRRTTAGTWAGDPARAARILVDVVNNPEPPLQLVLGAAAVEMVERATEERLAELRNWAEVSRAADFPASSE
ncbi:SDR family NAD(P)-dependent oxidoreductase [Actinoplanes sp. TBRC 11911]|uniref:SDR family NAD(P)-dependent oxidoreductase n=1 Tax=Actinoplanes sp. TBRC 11911 TaxID=2729386 RepID=UPI00145CFD0E|nr:SDR family NAD(P)-dependent oxidoreductase [Actinoplanes sp. TBRC 11911]NMO50788.1 SDR family NAD(P)-dependent oxidoreductase [Actinoplanes sp. TBRC 11911]